MEDDLIERDYSFSEREVADEESDSDDESFEGSFSEESHIFFVSFSIQYELDNELKWGQDGWPSQKSIVLCGSGVSSIQDPRYTCADDYWTYCDTVARDGK